MPGKGHIWAFSARRSMQLLINYIDLAITQSKQTMLQTRSDMFSAFKGK